MFEYESSKNIYDVIVYLAKNNQRELMNAVIDLLRESERSEAVVRYIVDRTKMEEGK